jgi:hypothetical protein
VSVHQGLKKENKMANAEEKPSAWDALHEYTKTVITLATGILAFTIIFMDAFSFQECADD